MDTTREDDPSRTTAVLTNVGLILASSASWLPPRYAALGATVSAAAYAIARGLAKLNPPKDAGTPPPA